MNNEPVAWMDSWGDVEKFNHNNENWTPLYTHPVKEQDTDCQYCKQGCIRCDARKQLTDEEIIEVQANTPFIDGYLNKNLIDFARAILRKAQEK